jgi:hypothetical protein
MKNNSINNKENLIVKLESFSGDIQVDLVGSNAIGVFNAYKGNTDNFYTCINFI